MPKNDEVEFIEAITVDFDEIVKIIYAGNSAETAGMLLGLREAEKRGIISLPKP